MYKVFNLCLGEGSDGRCADERLIGIWRGLHILQETALPKKEDEPSQTTSTLVVARQILAEFITLNGVDFQNPYLRIYFLAENIGLVFILKSPK